MMRILSLIILSLLVYVASFAQGPANDNCADALSITVGATCTFAAYSNVSTTAEPTSVAPNPTCGFYNGGDVWFTFVMPASGHLRMERTTLGGAAAQLVLYSGTCGSFTQLACLQSNATNAAININQPSFAGQTIYLRAFGLNSAAGGTFELCLWEAPIQPNDNCANATPITVGASCSMQSGANIYATAEPTSVAPDATCGFYSGGDVWYTFTMPASGGLRLEYSRISGAGTSFAFYTGTCGSFTEFSCLQNSGNSTAINFSRPDLAGQTIYLRAFGFGSNQGGEYNFCLWESPVPSNDNCANATPITVGASCSLQPGSNLYATAEATSVAPNATCGFYSGGDVWYTFTMPASGGLRLEYSRISGAGTSFAFYTGTCGSFTEFSCLQNSGNSTAINFSRPDLAGQTIYLRAFGFGSNQGGEYNFCLWESPVPSNDNCANATAISVGVSCSMQPGSNLYATAEATSVAPDATCGFYSGGDVWYTFTMPASGGLRLEYSRISGAGTSFAFYTGTCGTFTEFTCLNNSTSSAAINISRPDLAGQTIYLRAFGFGSNQGGEYNFCLWEAPIQPNDNCANATPITVGASCSLQPGSNLYATAEATSVAPDATCGFYSGGDVWYTFTMPASGALRLEYSRISGVATSFAFYIGTCGSFTEFSCLQNSGNSAAINISRPDLAGQTIYLRAFGYGSNQGGTYNFCVWEAPIPANDNCANATTLPVTPSCVLQEIDYRYATAEPTSVATNPSCGFYNGGDVWFTLTMPNSGQLQINRQHISGAQAQLALYSGTCGSFTQLSCLQTPAGTNNTLTFNDPALIGQTLYLRVFGYANPEGGQFRLCAFNPAAIEWTGAADSLWSNPANWQGGMVPQAGDNVLIPPVANQPVLTADATVARFIIQAGATLHLKDFILTVSDDIEGSGSVTSDFGRLKLTGKNSKTLVSGITAKDIEFNNQHGFELTGPLTTTGITYLSRGVVETTNTHILHLNGAVIAGGKADAFVSGPLRISKTQPNVATPPLSNELILSFDEADALFGIRVLGMMTFEEMDGLLKEAPTGKIGGRYAPVRLEKLDNLTTTFEVEYFDGNFGNNNVGSGLDRMSQQEYWKIDRVAGLGKANVELSFTDGDFSGIAEMDTADLVMARFGGSNWQIANGPRRIRGNATVGAVGAENLNEFGFFTFGSINGINPLAPLLPFIWSGDVSQLWGLPGNWQNNQVPPPGKKVTIPLTTNQPVLDQNRIIETLVIDNNATIQLGDYNLTIQGDIQGKGELLSTDWGRVIISGKNSKAQLDGIKVSNIEFNNFHGFELSDGDLEVQKVAYLTNGAVESATGKNLYLNESIIAGGKASAYVSGPMKIKKSGAVNTSTLTPAQIGIFDNANTLFEALVLGWITFDEMDGMLKEAPTGKIGGRYAPVRLEKLDSIPTTFEVEYFDGNFGNNNVGSGLDRMSQQEYWKIDRVAGLGKANVELSFTDGDFSGIAEMDTADLVMARFGGSNWQIANGPRRIRGNATVGAVGAENLNEFGFFTFGSINGINPLAPLLPFIWSGDVSQLWGLPGNWQNNQVPPPGKKVTIPLTTNQPVLDQNRIIETLLIDNNATIQLGDYNLTIQGDIQGKGELLSTDWGRVIVSGKNSKAQLDGIKVSNIEFNNFHGFELSDGDLEVQKVAYLTNGAVESATGKNLYLNESIIAGGKASAYVSGPMKIKKSGAVNTSTLTPAQIGIFDNANALFEALVLGWITYDEMDGHLKEAPTGKIGGRYAPVRLEKLDSIPTTFEVEYFDGNFGNNNVGSGLDRMSQQEYWKIDRVAGLGKANVELSFTDGDFSGIAEMDTADLVMARFGGSNWQIANGPRRIRGNATVGAVGAENLNEFGFFTFGSINGINPLAPLLPFIWSGDVSQLWGLPGNWQNNQVPPPGKKVTIPLTTNQPVLDQNRIIETLVIDNNATIQLGDYNLTIQGDIQGKGELLSTNWGRVIISGKNSKAQLDGVKVSNIEFNNFRGFELSDGDLEVQKVAYLTNGAVESATGKNLYLNESIIAGGKASAYVSGPMKIKKPGAVNTSTLTPAQIGIFDNANALFEALVLGHITYEEMDGLLKEAPTGKIGGRYAPVRLEKLDSIPTTFEVEYFDGNFGNNNVGSGLDRMSQQEYWKIDRVAGLGKANVDLSYRDGDYSGIALVDTADLVVVRFTGTNWVKPTGNRRVSGNATVGRVGVTNQNQFGFYTFGSVNGINPLAPILPFIWTGAIDTMWNNPNNWQNNQVPMPGKRVRVAENTTNKFNLDQDRFTEAFIFNGNNRREEQDNIGDFNLTILGDLTGKGNIVSTGGKVTLTEKEGTTQVGGPKIDRLTFNNPLGFTLTDTVTVKQQLEMLNGRVSVSPDAPFVVNAGFTLVTAGPQSHVNGPVFRLTEGSGTSGVKSLFVTDKIPTGKDGRYGPCGIENNEDTTSVFKAEYFTGAHFSTATDASLSHISSVEYWKIERPEGTDVADISLYFEDGSYSGIIYNNVSDLVVAWFNGTEWTVLPNDKVVSGNQQSGKVTLRDVNQFGYFTFGSVQGINPLNSFSTSVWTGAADNLWSNPLNWADSIVPNGMVNVIIPDSAQNNPLLDINAEVVNITVENGSTLNMELGSNLTVNGTISGSENIAGSEPGYFIGYSFPNAWSTVVSVTICPAGSYCPNGTEIFACEAGYFSSVAGAVACLPCAPGTFAPAQGATACFNCPAGTFQPEEAATECFTCASAENEATTDCGSCDTELTIAADPYILLCSGQTQTITVTFDVPVQNLQWYKGNNPIAGATGTSLLLNRWSLGVYTARAICGGQQIVSNPIIVNKITVITESGQNAHYKKFCSNTNTTLYAPELTGATYQWRVRPDGTLVSTTREHTFSGFSGSFDVFVTSPTGCTRSTRVRILIENQNNCPEDTLSSRPLENAKTGFFAGEVQLQFYPNPVKDNYVLYIEGLETEELFEIKWYDMSGREVLPKRQFMAVNGQKFEQSIEGLSKGIYLIQVASINHNFAFKVMVE